MKLRIQEIKKETFKLLGNCFGLYAECGFAKADKKDDHTRLQTPDFCNTRVNRIHGKKLSPNSFPE